VVATAGGIAATADLAGKTIAFGAKDSPQARLIPQQFLLERRLKPGTDYVEQRFDLLVGLHGDHIGGEQEAFRSLKEGRADASAMIDLNWDAWTNEGSIDPSRYRVLATTDRYDHCVFTVKSDFDREREREWLRVLFMMDYSNPSHREMMDLEGLRKWEPGRTTGFEALSRAIRELDI
jgi:ABC-type phosphate/phosphonate transport system substrate-binding protein